MKTLREYIDQLDEISRRDALKYAGATAAGAALGQPKDAKADWDALHNDDLLTGERKMTGFINKSKENPNVELVYNFWPNARSYVLSIDPVPLPDLYGRADGSVGGVLFIKSPYRILIGGKLYNDLQGGTFSSVKGTGMILAVQNGLNNEINSAVNQSIKNKETIKIEISQARQVFTFSGQNRFFEKLDETAEEDPIARIDRLFRDK